MSETELAKSMNEFLSKLQDDLKEAMNSMMCSKCQGKHRYSMDCVIQIVPLISIDFKLIPEKRKPVLTGTHTRIFKCWFLDCLADSLGSALF